MVAEILLLIAATCMAVAIVLLCKRDYAKEEVLDECESRERQLSHLKVAEMVADPTRTWRLKGPQYAKMPALESGAEDNRIVLRVCEGGRGQSAQVVVYLNEAPYRFEGELGDKIYSLWAMLCHGFRKQVPAYV